MNVRSLAAPALLALACYDYSAPSSVVNGAVVLTQFDQTANFGAYKYYAVNPTITVVDATGTVQTQCTVDGTPLLPTIQQQMSARGYVQVDFAAPGQPQPTPPPDLQITMHAALGSQDVYYPGWCYWYPYYYCYPGWSYAGSYSFGTLVLDMGVVKGLSQGEKIPLIWTNANYAVLASYYTGCNSNGNAVNWQKISDAVVRAFDQSPYIQAAP
jgi:hypothetical protein